jgi:hypothetical protein
MFVYIKNDNINSSLVSQKDKVWQATVDDVVYENVKLTDLIGQ